MGAPLTNAAASSAQEASILDLVEFAWRAKLWFLAAMVLSIACGLAVAFLTPPLYSASAVIAPKDPQKGLSTSGLLSQIGGGMGIGPILGGGNANLTKLELLSKSLELSETVIKEHDLLPALYPDDWDSAGKRWKTPERPPSLRKAAERLRKSILSVVNNPRQSVLIIEATFPDSVYAAKLVEYVIEALNRKVRNDVITESEANRAYLDSQMARSADPVFQQKVQELIGLEIEKAMLVSTKSVEVLIKPAVPMERLRPKRKVILVISFCLGLCAFAFGTIAAFFVSRNLEAIRERMGGRRPSQSGAR